METLTLAFFALLPFAALFGFPALLLWLVEREEVQDRERVRSAYRQAVHALPTRARVKLVRLHRKHKIAIHGLLMAAIVVSLLTEGGGLADWSFLALAVLVEKA